MAKLNLLPWREARRQQRKKEFYAMLGVVGAVGVGLAFLCYMFVQSQLDLQDERNARLTQEIAALDQQIAEIKTLDEERAGLLKRKEIIESLQASRSVMVHLFDELARSTPEGVQLTGIKQSGTTITLDGVSQSSARVAQFMRNLEASPFLKDADVKFVQRSTSNVDQAARRAPNAAQGKDNGFQLTLSLEERTIEGEGAAPEAPADAATTAAATP
jgi:type IV pilus assembly protein PilN